MDPVGCSRAFLSFRVRGGAFAMALPEVVETVRMVAVNPLADAGPSLLGVIDYRGTIVPVLDPSLRLGVASRPPGLDSKIIISRVRGRLLGIVVDDIDGLVEGQPQPIHPDGSPSGGSLSCISGALRMDDGLVLIVEPALLLSPVEKNVVEVRSTALAAGDVA